jgi:hypothetical protein
MSSITTDHQLTDAGPSLPEPHFDEAATVLSARPVVPLEEVEATSKRSLPRPWILAAALIGALLVGGFASAIYLSRSNGDEPKLFQDVELIAGIEGISEGTSGKPGESSVGSSGPASSQPQGESANPVETKKAATVKSVTTAPDRASAEPDKKPQPRLVAVIRDKKSNNPTNEERDAERKADRRQARKEHRRAERETRNGKADELFRIRDIFEGAPRPRN